MYKTTAHTRLTQLIKRYEKGTATPQEAAFVEQYYAYFDKRKDLTEGVTEEELEALQYKMLGQIHQQIATPAPVHRVHFLKTSWFRYAAAIILIIGGAAIWYTQSYKPKESVVKSGESGKSMVDIAPGGNRAILTVGNRSINLATNKTGITVNNTIAYNDGERIADAGQQLMLTTPRGGQYQVVLPDGSKVWLNAASSIKFPSKFTNSTREVEVTGEAYLEVAQNAMQPFYVHTNKTTIQVLGTSFNINSYEDEDAERTTLIEGSVKVKTDKSDVILKPNEQSIISNISEIKKITSISGSDTWRTGYFEFNKIGIEPIMRQLARWYDLEVKYEGKISSERLFVASMSRNEPVSKILEVLEMTRAVHFKIEGNKITVSP